MTRLDDANPQLTRSIASTIHVDQCSAMTFADGVIGITVIPGGGQTTLPLGGSPSTAQDLTIRRCVVDAAADTGTRRWTATPRLLPPGGTSAAERGRAFEVRYTIFR